MIRRATSEDADAIGGLFVRARDLMPYLPRIPDGDRPKVGGWIVERHEVWVSDENGVVGFAGLALGWLDHLYVDPALQSRGIGGALLDHSKALQPAGLQLWVFQKNEGARRFYERHGLELVQETNGRGNEEREPDAQYAWRPS